MVGRAYDMRCCGGDFGAPAAGIESMYAALAMLSRAKSKYGYTNTCYLSPVMNRTVLIIVGVVLGIAVLGLVIAYFLRKTEEEVRHLRSEGQELYATVLRVEEKVYRDRAAEVEGYKVSRREYIVWVSFTWNGQQRTEAFPTGEWSEASRYIGQGIRLRCGLARHFQKGVNIFRRGKGASRQVSFREPKHSEPPLSCLWEVGVPPS